MYRDPDRSELAVFAKHVQVAETLFVVSCELLDKRAQRDAPELRTAHAMAWVQLWEQLDFARTIAVKYGRDVSGLDIAKRRGNAGAVALFISRGNREAALRAFVEVRHCMPEIVIPTEIPAARRGEAPRPDEPPGWTWALVIAVVLLAVLAVLRDL